MTHPSSGHPALASAPEADRPRRAHANGRPGGGGGTGVACSGRQVPFTLRVPPVAMTALFGI
jgi:hypothetical protein